MTSAVKAAAAIKRPLGDIVAMLFLSWLVSTCPTILPLFPWKSTISVPKTPKKNKCRSRLFHLSFYSMGKKSSSTQKINEKKNLVVGMFVDSHRNQSGSRKELLWHKELVKFKHYEIADHMSMVISLISIKTQACIHSP